MGSADLKSLQEIIKEFSEKYHVPYEIIEQILIDFIAIEYYGLTGRKINSEDSFEF
jgi:phosphate starvation-inducible membrane PsiE